MIRDEVVRLRDFLLQRDAESRAREADDSSDPAIGTLLTFGTRELEQQIEVYRRAAEERLQAIETATQSQLALGDEIRSLRAELARTTDEAEKRLVEIADLMAILAEREAVIQALHTAASERLLLTDELSTAARRAQDEVQFLRGEVERLDEQLIALQRAADERLATIEISANEQRTLGDEVLALRAVVAERLTALEEAAAIQRALGEEIESLRAELDRRERESLVYRIAAEERLVAIERASERERSLREALARAEAEREHERAEASALHERLIDSERRIELVQRAADERLNAIEGAAIDQRALGDEVNALRAVVAERLAALEAAAATERALGERIESLHVEVERRERETEVYRAAAEERLAALERASEIERSLREALGHAAAAERDASDVERLRARLAHVESELETFRGAAADRLAALETAAGIERTLRGEIARLESEVAQRDAQLAIVQRAADERLALLDRNGSEIDEIRQEADKRSAIIAELTEVLEAQDREIVRLRQRE
jgi:chromosome segregation ATPase